MFISIGKEILTQARSQITPVLPEIISQDHHQASPDQELWLNAPPWPSHVRILGPIDRERRLGRRVLSMGDRLVWLRQRWLAVSKSWSKSNRECLCRASLRQQVVVESQHPPFDPGRSLASSGNPNVKCNLDRLDLETHSMLLSLPPGPLQSMA